MGISKITVMQKSILIQGTIKDHIQIQKIIDNLRIWFKDELVISTWEQETNKLTGYDKIVFCKDPGAGPFNGLLPIEQHCNLKRQLVGLNEGLKACSNNLIFKIRNDCLITKDVFRLYNFQQAKGNLKIFNNKIVVSNIMTTNPDSLDEPNTWFRISDWFYLGLKEDLQKVSDVFEQLDETDYSETFLGTEHILSFNLLKKYLFNDLSLEEYYKMIPFAWDYILSNFIVVDTISTAGIQNIGKWKHQPQYLKCYLTEFLYKEKVNGFK